MTQTKPRGKSKFSGCRYIREYYFTKPESQRLAPYEVYIEVLRRFNKKAFNLIREGEALDLGWGGQIKIVKRKNSKKRRSIDFKATKEHGVTIYHTNEHTGRFYYRHYWRKGKIKNVSAYSFIPSRGNKRALAAKSKNERIDFFE